MLVTDGSAKVTYKGRSWKAATIQPSTETILYETDDAGSSLAKLAAVLMVLEEIEGEVFIYTVGPTPKA